LHLVYRSRKRIISTIEKSHTWNKEGRRNGELSGIIKCAYIKGNPNFLSKDYAMLFTLQHI
jgi:hypothetical protein